jgi:hypothetical protein
MIRIERRSLTPRPDVAHLEHKVEDLQAQIRKLSVASVTDLRTQETEPDDQINSLPPLKQVDSALSMASSRRFSLDAFAAPSSRGSMEPFVDALYIDLKGQAPGSISVYRGSTTGVEIMRSLRHLCDAFVGFSLNPDHPETKMVNALDFQAPFEKLPMVSFAGSFLSPVHMIRRWIDLAFDEALVLFQFIDRDAVNNHIQRLFEHGISDQEGCDNGYIGLLHSIIALGQRHDPELASLTANQADAEETRG